MVNGEFLGRAKQGAVLINCGRGGLLDLDAALAALESGQLSGVGLDVFEIEPLPAGHLLTTLPNVTLSAHSGFRTPEANQRLIEAAFEHCRRIAGAARPAA